MLIDNYYSIRERVEAACTRAGREASEVKIVAVSKTKPLSMIEELADAGVADFGENYVQEMAEKASSTDRNVNWHFIGHLQTNKVKQVVGTAAWIHSVDSLHLALAISREAEKRGVDSVNVLIEINIGGEETKSGIGPDEAEELVRAAAALPHLCVRGLMAIVPPAAVPEDSRKYFRALEELRVRIQAKNIENAPMDQLSMGMTGDFEVAAEEGATMIRVGTAIFGARDYGIKS